MALNIHGGLQPDLTVEQEKVCGEVLRFLTSEDGINWKRPAINKFSFFGNINNNLTSYGTEGTGKVPNGSTMEPRFGSELMTLAGPWEARQVYTSEDGINFGLLPSQKNLNITPMEQPR